MTRLSTQDCLSSSLSDGEFALDFFSFKIFFFKFVYVFVCLSVHTHVPQEPAENWSRVQIQDVRLSSTGLCLLSYSGSYRPNLFLLAGIQIARCAWGYRSWARVFK